MKNIHLKKRMLIDFCRSMLNRFFLETFLPKPEVNLNNNSDWDRVKDWYIGEVEKGLIVANTGGRVVMLKTQVHAENFRINLSPREEFEGDLGLSLPNENNPGIFSALLPKMINILDEVINNQTINTLLSGLASASYPIVCCRNLNRFLAQFFAIISSNLKATKDWVIRGLTDVKVNPRGFLNSEELNLAKLGLLDFRSYNKRSVSPDFFKY
ncbi:MAG: hypothetical protein H6581_20710 [Bacteroidia bacterium]|nr:hypothetical protein [Bacteroidia bacterium]